MRNRDELAFFLSGAVFMSILAGIKYATQTYIGLVGLLIAFAFGGVVGLSAISKTDSWLKNALFIGAFTWILWAILNPIEVVGNNWVIQSTELLAIATVVVIFLEQDFLNMLRKMTDKPPRFGVGLLGSIMLIVFFFASGLNSAVGVWFADNWQWGLVALLAWWIYLAVIVNKGIKKLLKKIVDTLEGGKR